MKLIEKKLADLKAAQENGTYTCCPRCGRDTMDKELYRNALSRAADIMVCSGCGMDEAKLAYMNAHDSLYTWAALQPDKPVSDFKALTCTEVWKRIREEQFDTLRELYGRFKEGEDEEEIRLAGFESCPGLTEFWTRPFRLDYKAAHGRVVIMFRETADGIEMLGAVIESGKD